MTLFADCLRKNQEDRESLEPPTSFTIRSIRIIVDVLETDEVDS